MLGFKRSLALAVTAGAFAAMAIAMPASAASGEAACGLQGTASTSPPVAVTANSGSYSFSNGALQLACLVNGPNGVDVETLAVTSNGNYNNTVCGTGTADSTSNSINATHVAGSGDNSSLWSTANLKYHIQFAGGQGALTFGGGNVTGGGPISITAQGDGFNPPSVCTTHFTVAGAIAGVLA